MQKKALAMALWLGFLVPCSYAVVAEAYNSWNGYHWNVTQKSTVKNPLKIGDNVSPTWDTPLREAAADWNYSVIKNKVVRGVSDSTCSPVMGRAEVCDGEYGQTGWLGLTQLWLSPDGSGHITQATVQLNNTYFNSDFNSYAWRRNTLCHELGHVYGLDHQDTDFYNTNLGTCLDFSTDPDGTYYGQKSNLSPNKLDYSSIKSIYNHPISQTTQATLSSGQTGNGSSVSPEVPEQTATQSESGKKQNRMDKGKWGKRIDHGHSSNEEVYSRTLEDGTEVVTHVLMKNQ